MTACSSVDRPASPRRSHLEALGGVRARRRTLQPWRSSLTCLLCKSAGTAAVCALCRANGLTRWCLWNRDSDAQTKQNFTRLLAAGALTPRGQTSPIRRPVLSAREQQEQLLREDSGAGSTAGARARAQINYAKRNSPPATRGGGLTSPPTPHRV